MGGAKKLQYSTVTAIDHARAHSSARAPSSAPVRRPFGRLYNGWSCSCPCSCPGSGCVLRGVADTSSSTSVLYQCWCGNRGVMMMVCTAHPALARELCASQSGP